MEESGFWTKSKAMVMAKAMDMAMSAGHGHGQGHSPGPWPWPLPYCHGLGSCSPLGLRGLPQFAGRGPERLEQLERKSDALKTGDCELMIDDW